MINGVKIYQPITYTKHDKERKQEQSPQDPDDVRSPFERDRSRNPLNKPCSGVERLYPSVKAGIRSLGFV